MKTIKKILLASVLFIFTSINLSVINVAFSQGTYDSVLGKVSGGESDSLKSAIDGGDVVTGKKGSALFNEQVLKIIGYFIDIFIVVGIAVAFIGGYKIMTSDKEESMKEGIRLVIFGIIGIIIMISARFLAEGLVGGGGIISSEFTGSKGPNGVTFSKNLYEKIVYPFIKVALYFVIGILFFVMVGKVVSFVTATDDSAKKKAGGIIIWCVIGILIVMGSKQLVEAVMGEQDKVLNESAQWIDEYGNSILEFENIPIITQIINWVMGLTMLAIVVLIIIQGYKVFTNPDDPKTRESLKKAMLYIIIGVLIIGASYIISQVLVINNVPLDTVT